jgi:hypothetical protein
LQNLKQENENHLDSENKLPRREKGQHYDKKLHKLTAECPECGIMMENISKVKLHIFAKHYDPA